MTVICPKCGNPAVPTQTQYGLRHDCCGMWSWGGKPLADEETHDARKAAHAAFDLLWKSRGWRRSDAYESLAAKMQLSPNSFGDQ